MLNKKHIFLPYFIVAIFALTIGLYFRLYPLLSHVPGDSSEKATVLVLSKLKATVVHNVNATHPNLPAKEKNILIKKEFDKLLHDERDNVRKTIDKASQNIQQASPTSKRPPYLLASDSYYYYGLTKNIDQQGHLGGPVKGSKYLNSKMLTPVGHWEPFTLHPYVGYGIYAILKFFNPDISLMYAVSFTPLLITALALIPFVFICYFFALRPIVTFTGAVFFLLAPIFIKRSTFAWYDNDPYNILFPLTILAFLFAGMKSSGKMRYVYGFLTSLSILGYALFWQGWVFLFAIVLISGITMLLYNHFVLRQKSTTKSLITYFSVVAVGSFLAVSFVFGIQEFFVLFAEGWKALKNFLAPQLSPWPDLYISVSELKKSSLKEIIELTGGWLFFTVALLGLTAEGWRSRKESPFKVITITVFLVTSILISFGAQRFAMLCLVPLSLAFPLGLKKVTATFFEDNKIKKVAVTFFLVCLCLLPIRHIHGTVRSLLNPIFNETWEKTLVKINKETPENSVINTWWPPGHFIKSMAQRRVTFDGATINVPQAYWMANVFLSQSEEEALGLLRMLNNSGNGAAEYLQSLGFGLPETIFMLKEITKIDSSKARALLTKVIPDTKNIDHLLKLTHTSPPPSYFMIYNEFVENNLQLAFIGKWNFKQIAAINADTELFKKIPKRNSPAYVQFLWQLAGGPTKYSGPLAQLGQSDDTVIFAENVMIDLKTKACRINSAKYGQGIPQSIFYSNGNKVVEKKFKDGNLPYSLILAKEKGRYISVLMDRSLAQSLLMRLYYFNGQGLKHFKPFSKEIDLTGRTQIDVYEVMF